MLRATHADSRVVYARVVALAIIGSALILTAACGSSQGTTQTQSAGTLEASVTTRDSSAGTTSADVAPSEHQTTEGPGSVAPEPKNLQGLITRGRVLLESGKPREALRYAARAVALDERSHDAYRLLARAHAALNMPNEALVEYRLALSLEPEDAWSMNNLALILIQQQKYEEAIPALARAVQLDPRVAVFQNNLGIALEHTGHFTLATEAYHAAIAADSGYAKARLSLARVEGRREDPALTPVVLATLAESFDKEVRTTLVSVRPVKRDTLPR